MSEDLTMAERWALLRLEGLGSREAARAVGYSGGCPSPTARRLYRELRRIERHDGACQWLRSKFDQARDDVSVLRVQLRAFELWSRGV